MGWRRRKRVGTNGRIQLPRSFQPRGGTAAVVVIIALWSISATTVVDFVLGAFIFLNGVGFLRRVDRPKLLVHFGLRANRRFLEIQNGRRPP